MKKIILILTTFVIFFACKKENDADNPVISIVSPTTGQEFDYNKIAINFKIEDADLHEVGFTINRKSDDSLLYNEPMEHTHDNPFVFNDTLEIHVVDHTDAVLKIKAEDHNGNKAELTRNFHIHPHLHED